VQTNCFAQTASKPVADYRLAESSGYGKPDLRARSDWKRYSFPDFSAGLLRRDGDLQTERCEEWARVAEALVVHLTEVRAPEDPDRLWESELRPCDRDGLVQFGGANRALITDGELVAAPGAATGEDGAAILRLHAGAETMGLGALAIIWLKRTLWHLADLSTGGHTDGTPSEWSRNYKFTRVRDVSARFETGGLVTV